MTEYTPQFLAPDRLIASWDVSRSFLWRLEKASLLTPYYLFSRKLYSTEEVRCLEKMIERGELRAALRGAARKAKQLNPVNGVLRDHTVGAEKHDSKVPGND